jgi:hypothetical protein
MRANEFDEASEVHSSRLCREESRILENAKGAGWLGARDFYSQIKMQSTERGGL